MFVIQGCFSVAPRSGGAVRQGRARCALNERGRARVGSGIGWGPVEVASVPGDGTLLGHGDGRKLIVVGAVIIPPIWWSREIAVDDVVVEAWRAKKASTLLGAGPGGGRDGGY